MTVAIQKTSDTILSEADAERWRHVPVAIAIDVTHGACQLDAAIRPLRPAGQQPRLFARALTARCEPPDFGAVLHALDCAKPGDVLVIDAQGHNANAMIGGILGGHLHATGCRGIICDGAIRDVAELAGMNDFSVFTRHINPRGPESASRGTVQGALTIGKLIINPGDLVLGDNDGLAVLSPELARSAIGEAEAKMAKEREWIEGLAAGKTAAEVFSLKAPLTKQ